MIVTIRVEYEGRSSKEDLGVQEKLTTEQIDQANFDLPCFVVKKLRAMIEQALHEKNEDHTKSQLR